MSTATEKTAAELFNSGVSASGTREKLLEKAIDLFHEYGFHAVGLDRLLNEVGVTKTTFYNHFQSRDHLAAEAVRLRHTWEMAAFARELDEMVGPDAGPREKLIAVFDVIDKWFRHPDYGGCLFLSASHEFPNPHDPIRQAAGEHYLDVEKVMLALATEADIADPEALAAEWTMLIGGAFSLRQVSNRTDAAVIAKRLAEAALAQALPPDR